MLTNKDEMDKAVTRAAAVLEVGGVVLYATDTLYGLGVDATNKEAVQKIFELKERDKGKPLSVMVSDMVTAETYVKVSDLAKKLAERVLPGPFTFVLPKKDIVLNELTGGEETLGVRIPDSYLCVSLTKTFGKPITATSANSSGGEDLRTVDGILEQLGEKADLIDLVIDVGELDKKEASTVLRIAGDSVEVLREGNVNHMALLNVTKVE